jgi:phosphotransferase system enzyme I (PtsI)
MHPNHVLEVKQRVLTSDVPPLEALVTRMLRTDDPDRVAGYVQRLQA